MPMRSANIFHIAHSADWRKALERGIYSADTLEREGFIHCCFWDQVKKVGFQFFKNEEDLVLVEIDVSKLSSELIKRGEFRWRAGIISTCIWTDQFGSCSSCTGIYPGRFLNQS
jgi:hypothetical protein